MSTIDKFPIPGVSQPGQSGDAAPGSLLSQLRRTAAQQRDATTVTIDLTGRWRGLLRARYGAVGLDELERFQDVAQASGSSNLAMSLELLNRACQAIEAFNPQTGNWEVLEDDLGPVTFDDRLARLLQWQRPDDDFTFPVRTVCETMFDGNGFALGHHLGQVAEFLGLAEEEIASGKSSTGGGSTRSAPPPHSA